VIFARFAIDGLTVRGPSDIHVHTYDWLLERLAGILNFSGPAAHNPHLLKLRRGKSV
jgi:hypothetical protein